MKKIFGFNVFLDEKSKNVACEVSCNKEDFDPEALDLLVPLLTDLGKMIAVAYLKEVINFDDPTVIDLSKGDA